ncbi:MAG: glycosyltransferase [Albidovulum sp.]|uniref:glycosyltransferase n=1 Tax=Albidovulum sp. TaxID=1872424 RepID=UPI003CA370D8
MSAAVPHLQLVPEPATPRVTSDPGIATFPPRIQPSRRAEQRVPLGQILVDMGALDPGNLLKALALKDREDVPLGDILLTHRWVSEADLMAALSAQWGAKAVDLLKDPPDTRLMDRLGAEFCLSHYVLPWHRIGGATVLATSCPDHFAEMRTALPEGFGPVVMALAPERDIHAALIAARQTALIRGAETRVNAAESCRTQDTDRTRGLAFAVLGTTLATALVAPQVVLAALLLWASLSLIACSGLKLICFLSEVSAQRQKAATPPAALPARLPIVSVMVPLFREDDIAPRLIRRIGRIDYPKELLDILLVVEEDDAATLAALRRHDLPRWMRVVTVPDGPIRTKPRALNYALNFCRGSIVGVWDAEDAPEPQQIQKIVRHFNSAGPEVACLQGILDYYNARHNWLTRCFTVEYAAWFRAVLPGIARLGFVVPLGGTTQFFRRRVLEELGGWDAHNVTEDADLGLRLARHGYRTEMADTVTEEEPNSHAVTWIRQRSRWQKGFAITWATHMRAPQRLWRELGARRFLGVQIVFVGSLSQALLAPVLWSFWPVAFGWSHPLSGIMPATALTALCLLFIAAEIINVTVGLWATRGTSHRHLQKWVPTQHLYFPLACFSSYKAFYEWITRPFYWDKTAHGVVAARLNSGDLLPVLLLTDPILVPVVVPTLRLHVTQPDGPSSRGYTLPDDRAAAPLAMVAEDRAAFEPAPVRRPDLTLVSARTDDGPYILRSPLPGTGIKLKPGLESLGDM